MRIAYATTYDASDVLNWSGLGHYMAKSLELQGDSLEYIGPLYNRFEFPHKVKKWLLSKLSGKRYLIDRQPAVLKSYARQVQRSLRALRVDALFSPGTAPIAQLDTDIPMFFWTGSIFVGMINFYESFSNLTEESIKNGRRMETEVLSRCRLAIYASDWAADQAKVAYPEAKDKIRVVPYGANFKTEHSLEKIKALVRERPSNECRLLFNGVDWARKGGDLVLEVASRLSNQGLKVKLSVVGCNPPSPLPDYVKVHGFVSKSTPEGVALLEKLFAESHFLMCPSKAENFGVVFSEASSFGLPSIGRNVGGVSTAVRNGINGQIFEPEADASDFCQYISDLMLDPQRYAELALSSFNEYQTRLNWRVAGASVKKMMQEAM